MTNKKSTKSGDSFLSMIIECIKINKSINISKIKYITKFLIKFNMYNCKHDSTLLED